MRLRSRVIIPATLAVLLTIGLIVYLRFSLSDTMTALRLHPRPSGLTADVSATALDPLGAPEDASLLRLREGDTKALAGDWKGAEKEYAAAVAADGGVSALKKLALAQLQRGEFDAMGSTLDRLRREGVRAEDLLLLSVSLSLHRGNLDEADTLLAHAGDSPQKHYMAALLAIVRGNDEQAQAELKTAMDGWEPVLRTYAKTLQDAYDEFALFPRSTPLHLKTLLARALAQVQECALALPILTQVTQQQDDYRDAWIVQGYCQFVSERGQEALASLERAYALDPQKPEIQYFLGRTYASLGDHANALTFLQYALRNGFRPETDVRQALVTEAQASGDLQLAFEQEKILATASGADLRSFTSFVDLALKADRKDDAYEAARTATLRWPDDARAFDLLGSTAATLERKDDARMAFQRALELDGTLDDAKEKLLRL